MYNFNVHKDCRRTRGKGSTRKLNTVEQSMPALGRFDIDRISHFFKSVPSDFYGKTLFKRCDHNSDGHLSREELKAAISGLESRFSAFRASRALRCADVNEDGLISEEELDALVEYALNHGLTMNKE